MKSYSALIQELNNLLIENIDTLLQHIGLHYKNLGSYISLKCPVHESDSPRSLSIVRDENSPYYGGWTCWSKQCHTIWGKSILGFLRGTLSTQEGLTITKQATINYALSFLGYKSIYDIPLDIKTVKKKSLLALLII